MSYESLIENLHHPNAQIRKATVLIMGMVDEVRAMNPMQKRYARESNRNVKQAIQTVGGHLALRRRDGFDTLTALAEYFRIYEPDRRLQAQPPGAEDINPLIDELNSNRDSATRCEIIRQIAQTRNPGALAILAETFWLDEDPDVQAIAQQEGKILYWNMIYWQLAQDGTIETLIRKKENEPGIILPDQE